MKTFLSRGYFEPSGLVADLSRPTVFNLAHHAQLPHIQMQTVNYTLATGIKMLAKSIAITIIISLCLFGSQPVHSTTASPSHSRSALITPVADEAVLLGITRAGQRLVAVGERGVILLSDDNAASWRQANVPVSVSIVDVQFVDNQYGWAIGHSGVVLATEDGGENWTLQLDGVKAATIELDAAQSHDDKHRLQNAKRLVEDGPDKPFLSMHFSNRQYGIVAGAFGLAFRTEDGGKSWTSIIGHLPNDFGAHIYGISIQGQTIYIVGERGLFLRSKDGGNTFEKIETSYQGSFFSLTALSDTEILVGGLRGNVLISRNQADSFKSISNPNTDTINSVVTAKSDVLLADQSGRLMRLAKSDHLVTLSETHQPLTDIAQAANGEIVGVGFTGPHIIELPSNAIPKAIMKASNHQQHTEQDYE